MNDTAVADVVLGALVDQDRVLLVHRSPDKQAHPDVWDLPGGCVEEGESELGALARELREELGVCIATGAVCQLYRLTAWPAGEPALVSAWMVRKWEETPLNNAPEELHARNRDWITNLKLGGRSRRERERAIHPPTVACADQVRGEIPEVMPTVHAKAHPADVKYVRHRSARPKGSHPARDRRRM